MNKHTIPTIQDTFNEVLNHKIISIEAMTSDAKDMLNRKDYSGCAKQLEIISKYNQFEPYVLKAMFLVSESKNG